MRHRHHRIVRLTFREDDRSVWVVVSPSLRDDDTWDVLYTSGSREVCFEWVKGVDRTNSMRELAGRG